MALQTTTSLLLPAYTGHFLAEIIGANTTATTFVLDCDNDKNDDDCGLTRDTVIVGPWGDKTPAPGAPTTGIWREAMTIDEEDWTFSVRCDMSKTYAKTCTTINIGGNDEGHPTATFTQTASHDAYLFEDFHFGSFTWVPVTVTKGQKFLSASQKTAAPKALEAEMATTSSDMPASSITGDVVILTGSNGKGDLVTLTGSNSRTTGGAGGDDIVTLTGEAMPSDTSDSGAFGVRITKLFAAVTIATVVLVCS
ncbi:hypothetical protein FIE12Z_1752 [Fusarium flagelliforme]|uniref:Uncharacterized protein n=1 Tax=Fusarium flagelliforme TaxID=2675880 RepID=A0A395N1Z2_9HYPO|nr:hypothetical protein FIE12Z_1752 [Fusarium flagelliforme]